MVAYLETESAMKLGLRSPSVLNHVYRPGLWSGRRRRVPDPIDPDYLTLIRQFLERNSTSALLAVGTRGRPLLGWLTSLNQFGHIRFWLDAPDHDDQTESCHSGRRFSRVPESARAFDAVAPDCVFLDGNQPLAAVRAAFQAALGRAVPSMLIAGHASRSPVRDAGRTIRRTWSGVRATTCYATRVVGPHRKRLGDSCWPQRTRGSSASSNRSASGELIPSAAVASTSLSLTGGPERWPTILPGIVKYAKLTGDQVVVLCELQAHHPTPHFIKLDIFQDALNRSFDQVLYVDVDVLISRAAPDIFERPGAACTTTPLATTGICSRTVSDMLFNGGVVESGAYFNTGVMLLDPRITPASTRRGAVPLQPVRP